MSVKSFKGSANTILVALLVVAAFLVGSFWTRIQYMEKGSSAPANNNQGNNTVTGNPLPTQPPALSLDKVKSLFVAGFIHFGDAKRKVLFVEVSDPSCPYCQVAAGKNPELSKQAGTRFQYVSDGGTYNPPVPEIKKLVDAGKASLAVIYYPGHGNGILAMQALYCAFDKNKYWEVHDKLMSNEGYDLINNTVKNDKVNIPQLVDFLSNQIDATFLKSCLESGKYESILSRDQQLGPTFQVQGTPHFLLNTTIYGGAVDFKNGGMEQEVNKLLSQ